MGRVRGAKPPSRAPSPAQGTLAGAHDRSPGLVIGIPLVQWCEVGEDSSSTCARLESAGQVGTTEGTPVHGRHGDDTQDPGNTTGRTQLDPPRGTAAPPASERLLSLPAGSPATLADVTEVAGRLARAINTVIEGKPDVVHTAITVLLAEGHLLLEDVPGVGKTMLAKTLARSIDCSVRRVQFTPDLLPSDITGVSVFNQDVRDFEFRPGAIFANVVVGDEINRASPKTQSALLECMEERQVPIDGVTYSLSAP